MDSPLTWGILVILAIAGLIWFVGKCEDELAQNRKEQEEFWNNWEK